jgi:hypothetical protein
MTIAVVLAPAVKLRNPSMRVCVTTIQLGSFGSGVAGSVATTLSVLFVLATAVTDATALFSMSTPSSSSQ